MPALPGWEGWQQPTPGLGDQGWGMQAPRQDSLGWQCHGGEIHRSAGTVLAGHPRCDSKYRDPFLNLADRQEARECHGPGHETCLSNSPQAEKMWESHQLEAWKALSSKSPGWEGQCGPNGAAGVILHQCEALPHPGRQTGRDPLLPSSLGVQQTGTAVTSRGREKALWVFGSSDSHSGRLEGLLC